MFQVSEKIRSSATEILFGGVEGERGTSEVTIDRLGDAMEGVKIGGSSTSSTWIIGISHS